MLNHISIERCKMILSYYAIYGGKGAIQEQKRLNDDVLLNVYKSAKRYLDVLPDEYFKEAMKRLRTRIDEMIQWLLDNGYMEVLKDYFFMEPDKIYLCLSNKGESTISFDNDDRLIIDFPFKAQEV